MILAHDFRGFSPWSVGPLLGVSVDIVYCDQKWEVKEICSLNGGQGARNDGKGIWT